MSRFRPSLLTPTLLLFLLGWPQPRAAPEAVAGPYNGSFIHGGLGLSS